MISGFRARERIRTADDRNGDGANGQWHTRPNESKMCGRWGQTGEHIVGGDSEAGDGAISEGEDSGDGVDVLPDLSCNGFHLIL